MYHISTMLSYSENDSGKEKWKRGGEKNKNKKGKKEVKKPLQQPGDLGIA